MKKPAVKPALTNCSVTSDVIEIASDLIRCPSVTPTTAGVFDVIEAYLKPLGFIAHRATFEAEGFDTVENLYLRFGTQAPNFCFAGHTDVVPPGNVASWTVPPFSPHIIGGELYGRGAEDMKGAIAAFMVAAKNFIQDLDPAVRSVSEPLAAGVSVSEGGKTPFKGSISLLITQDEEGWAVNGTRKMLDWLKDKGEILTHCLVGEPTNPDTLGEMVKNGRRGSVSFHITVNGKQGHVAYPARADNPVTRLVNMLHALKAEPIDAGNEHFPPTNLEISSVDVGNPTYNVIPATAEARVNVRFNNIHSSKDIESIVRKRIAPFGTADIVVRVTGEPFLTRDEKLIEVVTNAVKDITGIMPVLSTTGGTSDARFIKDFCPVIEFGTTGKTPHMVDERVSIETLEGLVDIYGRVLSRYFA
jgi:succinyl-diaminopimelate desuccinylase